MHYIEYPADIALFLTLPAPEASAAITPVLLIKFLVLTLALATPNAKIPLSPP